MDKKKNAGKGSTILKLVTEEAQVDRELKLARRVMQAIAEYCRAGNPPTLKDARIVESVVKRAAATLREAINEGQSYTHPRA